MARQFDHVVVGAGSAGCLVARRVSDAGHTVALLEAGPGGPEPASIVSPNWLRALAEPERTWPDVVVQRGGEEVRYWRGRGVGGSSAVNGLVALPGPIEDYLPWLGTEDEVASAVATVMNDLAPTTLPLGFLASALSASAVGLTLRNGERNSAAAVYLTGASDRLSVRSSSQVERLVVRTGTTTNSVTGVVLDDGTEISAGTVWVCAGTIHSPKLLLGSGIAHDSIGHGLQDHVAIRFDVTIPEHARRPGGVTNMSPVTGLATLSSGIVDQSTGERSSGDTQMLVMDHSGEPGIGTVLAAVLRVESVGRLTEAADGSSVADPNLADHPLDRERLQWISAEVVRRLDDAGLDYQSSGLGDYVHAVGTCAMGSVVDNHGCVDGYTGLRVVDASVIPRIPRANTHVPTLVVADCVTRRALAE